MYLVRSSFLNWVDKGLKHHFKSTNRVLYYILFVIYFRFAKKDQGILARILELKCITKMFNVYLNLIIFLFLGPQNYKNEFLR